MTTSKFVYLLNAMENAALTKEPAKAGYAERRQELLAYVEQIEREHREMASFIGEMRDRVERIEPMLRFVLGAKR